MSRTHKEKCGCVVLRDREVIVEMCPPCKAGWSELHEQAKQDHAQPLVECPECGNEQPDMGRNMKCEECGHAPMPYEGDDERMVYS